MSICQVQLGWAQQLESTVNADQGFRSQPFKRLSFGLSTILLLVSPVLLGLQLKGHGSFSELGELDGSRRFTKVLLAEDNLINMKVSSNISELLGVSQIQENKTQTLLLLRNYV